MTDGVSNAIRNASAVVDVIGAVAAASSGPGNGSDRGVYLTLEIGPQVDVP